MLCRRLERVDERDYNNNDKRRHNTSHRGKRRDLYTDFVEVRCTKFLREFNNEKR